MRIAVIAQRSTPTNEKLSSQRAEGAFWLRLTPQEAVERLRAGDVAVGRLDVRPTVDGIDDGIWALGELEARGVRVLNGPAALLAAHDKLLTARVLRRAGLPHPRTRLLAYGGRMPLIRSPVVVKPRFGSWGRGVERCETVAELAGLLERLQGEGWFQAHGAIVQELVPPLGYDLRVVVAGGSVVGAVTRVAVPGEWRTNVALGAQRLPVRPTPEASAIALAAAAAAGADLVGVDLLPKDDGWVVLELNGAVEFTADYDLDGDVFATTAAALCRAALGDEPTAASEPVLA
jgi:RimK family alpha-L-glutamate ligase